MKGALPMVTTGVTGAYPGGGALGNGAEHSARVVHLEGEGAAVFNTPAPIRNLLKAALKDC